MARNSRPLSGEVVRAWRRGVGIGLFHKVAQVDRVSCTPLLAAHPTAQFHAAAHHAQGYQSEGLGTFPARTILQEAKAKGFHRVSLEVVADNTGAIKAYEQAGFLHEGRMKDGFLDDNGKYHDQLIMGIIL